MAEGRGTLPVVLVVASLLSWAGCAEEAPEVAGTWLWAQEVENGSVVRTITDADMVPEVGSSGWPGCPDGIICTHYGIQKLDFGADGAVHFINNVTTSSDFHKKGSYAVSGDLITFTFTENFSCAHPDQRDTERRLGAMRWKIQDGNLWLSVTGFGSSYPFFDAPPENPTRWVVFRPISFEDWDNRYMIRLCQAATPDGCHPDCFPERFGGSF